MAQMSAWMNYFGGNYDVYTRSDRKAPWVLRKGTLQLSFDLNGPTEDLQPAVGGGNCMIVKFSGGADWPIREGYFHLLRDSTKHRLGINHEGQANMPGDAVLDGGALVGLLRNHFVHLGFTECDESGGGPITLASGMQSIFRPQNVPGKIKFEGNEYTIISSQPQKYIEVQLRSREHHVRPDVNYPWNIK